MNSDEEDDLLFNRNRAGWKNVKLAPEERLSECPLLPPFPLRLCCSTRDGLVVWRK